MASRFRSLLRSEGRDVIEPSGQDGRRCQYLAFADQLERKRCVPAGTCDANQLELSMIDWLWEYRSRNSYAQPRTSEAWAPTVCRHRRPLWAQSARTILGRMHIRCSLAVWKAHDARARALCRSQPRARSRAAAIPMRSFERVRRGHPPYAAIAGHFGLDRLSPHADACVSVARALCGGRTMHGLRHYAARNHALARAQPQFLCAASNE